MSIESALRELGKEIQKDERFIALQAAAKVNDADESLQQQMQEMQLISLKYQQEAEKGEEAHRKEFKNFKRIIRSFIQKLWQAKICKCYSSAASEMEKWHSISAV